MTTTEKTPIPVRVQEILDEAEGWGMVIECEQPEGIAAQWTIRRPCANPLEMSMVITLRPGKREQTRLSLAIVDPMPGDTTPEVRIARQDAGYWLAVLAGDDPHRRS